MIIIVIHIIRCLVKGDKIMKLKEHLVARELAEIEIRNMIKDFRKGRPILRDCEWMDGGKNKNFAQIFEDKTNRTLTDKIIKSEIISELSFDMFVDVIYPKYCDDEKDLIKKKELCIRTIELGNLLWVFHFKNYITYDSRGNDIKMGDLYIKLEPISGEVFIVKSLHTPKELDCDGEFTERDLSMVKLYDEYMNGKIK